MAWRAYQVVFRLRTPLHVGWGKVGNMQRTRAYVTGRVFWGALTMRLTRDGAKGPATDSRIYQEAGQQVHDSLAYTYFYVATKNQRSDGYAIAWPWENESRFRRRFLSSYASTALVYPQQTAAEGMLHEVEFISPYTLDLGEPVYLIGYVFEQDGCPLRWRDACRRLQLGGERGYGWGDVELGGEPSSCSGNDLFNGKAVFDGSGDQVILQATGQLLAHAVAKSLLVSGEVEPLVGREWRSHNQHNRYAGQHIEMVGICLTPGSTIAQQLIFVIREFGVWHLSA